MAGSRPLVEIELKGVKELQRELKQIPDFMPHLFKQLSEYGQQQMRKHAKPHPADKGTLAEAVTHRLRGEGMALEATVGLLGRGHGMRSSLAGLAPVVNWGRRPGKAPSIARITFWLKSHGIPRNPREVQIIIAKRGTKGVLFLEKTEADLKRRLPALLQDAKRRIERNWGR